MAGVRTFVVRFLADADQYKKGIKQVNDGMGGLKTQVSSLLPSFKTVAIAGAAAFGAVSTLLYKSVGAAIDASAEQNRLRQILETTTGATDEQIESLNKQAKALQDLGVVSAGTTSIVQSQLATFDLSVETIKTLTPAILNYVTAEKGAKASADDFKSSTNGLAQALQGNFASLTKTGFVLDDATKKTIKSGTESERSAALVSVLDSTYKDFNKTLRDTPEGQLQALKNSMSDAATELGTVLLPYFTKFVTFINDFVVPAVKVFAANVGEKGIVQAFRLFVDELGIVGAYVDRFVISFAISWNNLMQDVHKGLATLTLGLTYLVPGFAAAGTEIQNRLLSLGLQYDANTMFIQDFKNASVAAGREMRINGAASARLTGQARALAASMKETVTTTDDKTGVAKAVKTATEKLKIYTDALKSSNSAQKSFTAAQKASVRAGQSLTEANTNLADAQAAFNAAVAGYGADSPQAKKAAFELAQAQRGLERAGYNVEGSLFAIADAEEALKKVRADPESTPQAIREAEISLAEAKLSSADAIDAQTEATDGLTKATGLLNDAIFGASVGSDIYTQLSDALTDAKQQQADATDAVAEAIDRETEALKNYADAIEAAGKIALLYPKVVAANPMAGVAGTIAATVTGNSTGFNAGSGGGFSPIINVNAGMISDPATLAYDLDELLNNFARQNGNQFYGLTR